MGRKATSDEQIRRADDERAALERFISRRRIIKTDWARRARISEGTLRNFLNRTSHSLSANTWSALAEAEGVEISEILSGVTKSPQSRRSEVDFSRKIPVVPGERDLPLLKMSAVRVIGDVQAGMFRDALEWPPEDHFDIMAEIPSNAAKYRPFGLRVIGPSMNKEFPEGSIAVCVKLHDLGEGFEIQSGKFVVILRHHPGGLDEWEATLKEFVVDADGVAWLWPRSNHPEFQTPIRAGSLTKSSHEDANDEVQIWAVVIGKHVPYSL